MVLAGHGHLNESTQTGRKMMAAHFQEISKINPVTIDQTTLESITSPQLTAVGAYMLVDKEKASMNFPVQIQSDLKIYNNFNLADLNNCFSSSESSNVTIEVPKDSLPPNQNCLLLVYKAKELIKGIHPVPTAIKYLKKSNAVNTKLCPGEYVVVVKNYFGEILWQRKLRVN